MDVENESARIRAQLARDRAILTASLQGLRARLTPGGLLREGAADLLRGSTSPYAQAMEDAIRANPVALVLTGAGLAWLAFGKRKDTGADDDILAADLAQADWNSEVETLRVRAATLLRRIDAARRGGLASDAELEQHRAEVVTALAHQVRQAISRGLAALSDEAKAAEIAAREAALIARLEAETAEPGRAAVLAGALLAATGALLAAVLPQSNAEERVLQRLRDQVVREIRHAARDEGRHLRQTAAALAEAFKAEIDRAKDRVDRVVSQERRRA
jgi:hypothetical protein